MTNGWPGGRYSKGTRPHVHRCMTCGKRFIDDIGTKPYEEVQPIAIVSTKPETKYCADCGYVKAWNGFCNGCNRFSPDRVD